VFSAVAGRLTAASGHRSDGAGSQITQAEELFQDLDRWVSKVARSSDIRVFLSIAQLVCTYRDAQNYAIKKGNPLGDSYMSPAPCQGTH
jgi:hypothetical protein